MEFIVTNWLWFLLAAGIFILLAFVNMFTLFARASQLKSPGVGILLHIVFGLGYGGCILMFIIGAIVHIVRYANKA